MPMAITDWLMGWAVAGMLGIRLSLRLEARSEIPDRNVERLLASTHVPALAHTQLRLDLVVPGLNVARGLPLICDVTILSPLTHGGQPWREVYHCSAM